MKLIKEIRSKSGELHFKRWRLFSIPWVCSVYIHGIYKADEDNYLHNHPWNIWTMIIKGGYFEELHTGKHRLRLPGHTAYANTSAFHKISKMHKTPTYTLAIVGRRKNQEWGYMVDGRFIDHKTFRENKNKKRDL